MLLNIDEFATKTIINGSYLPKITSPSIKLRSGVYDSKGLFSVDYFGQMGSEKWRTMYGCIELPHPVLHPAIFYIIQRRISFLLKWIELKIGINYDPKLKNYVLTDEVNSYDFCGLTDLYKNGQQLQTIFNEINKLETLSSKAVMNKIAKNVPAIFTKHILIPPPVYRPNDEDNKIYVKVLEELSILRSAIESKDKILTNRILSNVQWIYNEIFESMINKIKGKYGLIRGSISGRNADFSGRAVIVGDPRIKPDEIGVPTTMLVRLFYPWMIYYIIKNRTSPEVMELSKYVPINKPSLHILINEKLLNEDLPERVFEILVDIAVKVSSDKVVIAKRDPALHKLSVRAYKPVPIKDSSLHISPMICSGHNADFDGDQMAIFVPLSDKAQKITREKMLSVNNIYHPKGGVSLSLEKDFVFGVFTLTKDDPKNNNPIKFENNADLMKVLLDSDDFTVMIDYRGRKNSLGRRLIEVIFGDKIQVTEPINGKKLEAIFEKFTDEREWLVTRMYLIQQIAEYASTVFGGTMSASDFILPKDLVERKKEVLSNPDKYDVDIELEAITKEFMKRMEANNQFPAVVVGAGVRGDIKQMSVAKGYISDVNGKIIPSPIKSNFVDGFSPSDYFLAASGSRKGVVDRVMNTAKSGYLTRQMVLLLATVKASDTKFCGTKKLLEVVLTKDLVKPFLNRTLENGAILTKEYVENNNLIDKPIKIYSPLYCRSHGLCKYCFPEEYRRYVNDVENVGIISAQIVGERATQLTMRTFHTGGAASVVYIAQECPQTKEYIAQDGMVLKCLKPIKIKVKDPDVESTTKFMSRWFNIIVGENEIKCNLSSNIIFDASGSEDLDQIDKDVIITYDAGDIIGEIEASATDVTAAVTTIQSILNHAVDYESAEQIIFELYHTFKVATEIPMIYLEILVSQIIRDPERKFLPYRLGAMNKEPFFAGIKAVPALENPLRGIVFERVSDVLMSSIINDYDYTNKPKSDLEQMLEW